MQQLAPAPLATQQHHAETHATSSTTIQSTNTSSEDRLVAAMAAQSEATRADTAANTQCIMENMAKMFGMARQESLDREVVLRDEITTTVAVNTKEAAALAAQVTHLTNTVTSL